MVNTNRRKLVQAIGILSGGWPLLSNIKFSPAHGEPVLTRKGPILADQFDVAVAPEEGKWIRCTFDFGTGISESFAAEGSSHEIPADWEKVPSNGFILTREADGAIALRIDGE